ncbi:unnamed protein product [Fusarium equiseti]|uniref:Uncharacterized protein n=1 Tax=Fusarium equiseti TaxID=61235 RepID=A0A8J2NDK6_FUSEQ|nr:unnamed protein product [Fusarium equiseti]
MSVMTISSKADLQKLIGNYPVVIVAGWDTAVTTSEASEKEIERLAQREGYNHDKGVFAKFILEGFNDLVHYLETASDIIIVTTFNTEITIQGMFDYYLKYYKLIIVHIWKQDSETLSLVFEHLAKTRTHDEDEVVFAKIFLIRCQNWDNSIISTLYRISWRFTIGNSFLGWQNQSSPCCGRLDNGADLKTA